MARDYRKLRVCLMADALAIEIHRRTATFPSQERYGLQSQIRRAAVSTGSNIVAGSTRRSMGEYVNFINLANGSAHEVRYLLELTRRLEFLSEEDFGPLHHRATLLTAGLGALLRSLKPEA